MRKLFSNHNSQKGQSLTELAVSVVILLILVAGMFDVGRAIFTYLSMRDAAQEGASYAAIIFLKDKDDTRTDAQFRSDGCTAVHDRTMLNVEDSNTSVVTLINGIDCASASLLHDACAGHEARVTVQLRLPVTTPFIGAFIGQDITLRATATDTILRPYCK
ncbi:Flp pilus assembly protein TadG [Longilinea arvoryzae]|uniref:Flp pilus assembly protein TadG n=1 Tax=Longilinea arvoryzae TaxID=360412 RepID=A0A0S7BN06_9CHLR|nr:TadE/TadG family type IV pilus assembly protein [Longilinea arvoryzae]GAP15650.1 Flp pilus assembly protein TadG [Longilinea arvoryzae]